MVATEPLPPTLDHLVYARWGYEYLQQRPDGRILAGGFSDVDAEGSYTDSDVGEPADLGARRGATCAMTSARPARVSHRWAGVVGYSDDSLPYVGEVPGRAGLYVSGGYSGVGQRAGLHVRARPGRHDRGRWPGASLPGRPRAMDAERIRELSAREAERFAERTSASKAMFERARAHARGRRLVLVPRPRAVARVSRARRGSAGLGRGRQRVRRLPQRLQRDGPGPRAPGGRRGRQGASGPRHALRRHHRGRRGGGGGASAPLRAPALALHQLRHRGEHGRDPARARAHGPRGRGADGGRLPRTRRDLAPARGSASTTRRRSSA